MWNGEKSIILTKLCIVIFMGLLLAVVVSAPWLTDWFTDVSQAGQGENRAYFMATIYVGFVPAAYLLYSLSVSYTHLSLFASINRGTPITIYVKQGESFI